MEFIYDGCGVLGVWFWFVQLSLQQVLFVHAEFFYLSN